MIIFWLRSFSISLADVTTINKHIVKYWKEIAVLVTYSSVQTDINCNCQFDVVNWAPIELSYCETWMFYVLITFRHWNVTILIPVIVKSNKIVLSTFYQTFSMYAEQYYFTHIITIAFITHTELMSPKYNISVSIIKETQFPLLFHISTTVKYYVENIYFHWKEFWAFIAMYLTCSLYFWGIELFNLNGIYFNEKYLDKNFGDVKFITNYRHELVVIWEYINIWANYQTFFS